MKIENVKVYDLEESLIASGLPMRTTSESRELTEKDLTRGRKLSKLTFTDDNAHDQFLTGIRVAFDLTCTNKVWVEVERYRFLEFVSSQSTMHRITRFDLDEAYNEFVDPRVIEIMKEKVQQYNALDAEKPEDEYGKKRIEELKRQKYMEILYTNPAGFQLTARLTTNYRCLKNIYQQRRDHRLQEWRDICAWIETLPYAHELIICDI